LEKTNGDKAIPCVKVLAARLGSDVLYLGMKLSLSCHALAIACNLYTCFPYFTALLCKQSTINCTYESRVHNPSHFIAFRGSAPPPNMQHNLYAVISTLSSSSYCLLDYRPSPPESGRGAQDWLRGAELYAMCNEDWTF
jgi:hypothetical protein